MDNQVFLFGKITNQAEEVSTLSFNSLPHLKKGSFFAIDNCEKDSGLINLSFGDSKPSDFETGGHWKSTGSGSFEGDYVDYLSKDWNCKLVGKLNILVSRVSENKTRIRISARYLFIAHSRQSGESQTWSFDTGSCDTITPTNPASGTPKFRTICPTYKAEGAIINTVK